MEVNTLNKSKKKAFLTKDKKYKPKGGAIKIQTYHIPTQEIKNWGSVHKFRAYSNYNAFSGEQLENIRANKLIKIKDYFICKQEEMLDVKELISVKVGCRYSFKRENLKILQMIEKSKEYTDKQNKLKELEEIKYENENSYKNSVLILDENFSIKELYIGKITDLAEREGINYNNMKSLLFKHKHRKENFYNNIPVKSYNGKNFCYLTDY